MAVPWPLMVDASPPGRVVVLLVAARPGMGLVAGVLGTAGYWLVRRVVRQGRWLAGTGPWCGTRGALGARCLTPGPCPPVSARVPCKQAGGVLYDPDSSRQQQKEPCAGMVGHGRVLDSAGGRCVAPSLL